MWTPQSLNLARFARLEDDVPAIDHRAGAEDGLGILTL